MRQESETFVSACGFSVNPRLGASAPEFCDRARNRVVKTPIQNAEVFGADRRACFDREVGDRLAHIPVVVDHLRDSKPLAKEIAPVQDGAPRNFWMEVEIPCAQRGHQLIQEQRHAVISLCGGGWWD
jgi:hypothetical protein